MKIGRWRFDAALDTHGDVTAAFGDACARLERAGATLIDVAPEAYRYGASRRKGLLISEIEGHKMHADALATSPEGFSETFKSLLSWGVRQAGDKRAAAYEAIADVEADAARWFGEVDLVISPTALEPAFPFGAPVPAGQADLTAFADMAGSPATAVPMGLSASGLPLSIQFMAAHGRDRLAMKAATQFEILNEGPLIPPGY